MHRIWLLFLLACDPRMAPAPAHCSGAEAVRVETDDDAEVALHRHAGSGPPVILIHGISSNHRFWDLTPDHSMALILQEAGFDPWLLDLRGHGDAVYKADGTRQRSGWDIDDYGRFDLAAAIHSVKQATGHDKVAVIGHSMGGMVASIYASIHGDDELAALVTVGSPAAFPSQDLHSWLGKTIAAMGTVPASIGMPSVARFMGGWQGHIPLRGEGILFTTSNLPIHMRRRMLNHIASPVSRGEFTQLQRMFKTGRLVSTDGSIDHSARLADLTVPVLAIGGGGDFIVPPGRISPWATVTGSEDVTVSMASKANGYVADYGHLDLALGPAAPREVLHPIADWLKARQDRW